MLIVDKFCCFSLKNGAIIVGYLILILWGSFRFVPALELIREINYGEHDEFFEKYDVEKNQATAALVVIFIFSIFLTLVAVSLLFGAQNKKPAFILPVLIFIPVDLVAGWIFSIIVSSGYVSSTVVLSGWISTMVILVFIVMVIYSVLGCYFWICIFSLWQHLKEESGAAKESNETPAEVQESPI